MKTKYRVLIVSLSLSILCGCLQPLAGTVSTSTSKFDSTKQIAVEPAWVYPGFKLGGHWNDKMGDVVMLEAVVRGVENIQVLQLNIDGEIVTLMPEDQATDHEYSPGVYTSVASAPGGAWSARRFQTDKALIEKIAYASKVMGKLTLSSGSVEGEFRNGMQMAKPAFVKFSAQLRAAKTD